jgi:VanZ family protein
MTNERQGLWWTLWALYASAWTVALVSTFPIKVRNAVTPEEYWFSLGKTLHVTAYAVFTILSSRLSARRWLLLVVILHGPLTEFLQQFTERTPEVTDVLLDWLGVSLGVALSWRKWRPQTS